MSALQSGTSSRSHRAVFLVLAMLMAALAGAAWYLWPRFEREPPQIRISPDVDVLGQAALEIVAGDAGAGLRSVTATLESGGKEVMLASEHYAEAVRERKIALTLSPKLAGVKEGPATLRVSARDHSWWAFGKGNGSVFERKLTIDLTPPAIELIADDRYINFGGVGVIVYKVSADAATSGVKVGNYFFPGYPGQVTTHPERYIAFFAHPYDTPADAKAALVATDRAGNTREMRLVYELKNVKYRKSTIELSDAFIQNKVAPLLAGAGERHGMPKEIFVRVNKALRKLNEDRIAEITSRGTPTILWKGAFSQLSNSKVEANFADARTYTYNGETIDHAYHLGYDLSVTRRYPVEAANSGVVAHVGDLGIYGNTVVIDHGLGLYTLYSHLSSIDVKVGEAITQRQIIGRTGETGLAAGDHLHFGVYLHGVPVLPVEWWDPKWINDNIQPKLDGHDGVAIARSQEAQIPRAAARKRRR